MTDRFFTNSELALARRCKRHWYLSQYRRLYRSKKSYAESTTVGNYCHEALAVMYNHPGTDPVAVVVQEAATDRAQQETDLVNANEVAQSIIFENIEVIDKAEKLAKIMVEGYVAWLAEEGEDSFLSLLSAEEEVSVLFPSEQVQSFGFAVFLLAKLDARFLDERSGARVFMDHKTVQNFADRERWANIDTQFLFYSLVDYLKLTTEAEEGTISVAWTDSGVLNMLRKVKRTGRAKPPFYKRVSVPHSIKELANFHFRTSYEILAILQMEESLNAGAPDLAVCPPNPTRDCTWDCPFFQVCPMMDDGSDVSGFINEAYEIGNPLHRYKSLPDPEVKS